MLLSAELLYMVQRVNQQQSAKLLPPIWYLGSTKTLLPSRNFAKNCCYLITQLYFWVCFKHLSTTGPGG